MIQKISKIIKKSWPFLLFVVVLLIMSKTSFAQSYLGEGWDKYLEGRLEGFSDISGKTGEDLAIDFIRNLVVIARYLIGALALIMGIIYGMSLVFARGREDAIQNAKKNFLYIFIGFIVIIASENIANIFNPETSSSDRIIDFTSANDQLRDAIDYVKWLLGSIVVLFMTVSAIRMMTSQAEEEQLTKQKRNITWGFIGLLLILLGDNIVDAVYVVNTPDEIVAGAPESTVNEIASFVQLILVFLGPIAIIFTIYAGFTYLTAMDSEERASKAKRMIIAGIIGVVIIYSAYALVNTIASERIALLTNSMLC